jgi:hypothetical protein
LTSGNVTGKKNAIEWGGCFVLVDLMKNCLEKAIARIPACNQITELNEVAELTTIDMTFSVIINFINWTVDNDVSRDGIAAIGGVEAIFRVMKTFPECRALQEHACPALFSLISRNETGQKKAIESGGCFVFVHLMKN